MRSRRVANPRESPDLRSGHPDGPGTLQCRAAGADTTSMAIASAGGGDLPHGWAPRWLPRGHALAAADWRRRHHGVCAVLLLHVLAVPVYALVWGEPVLTSLGFGAVLAVFLAAALPAWTPPRVRSCAAALGLMVAAGEVVQISHGWTEAHLHFFVLVPVVALYEAWAPFALAAGYVLFQHGVVGTLFPRVVFHSPAAHEHPWLFALVHTGAFAVTCAGSLTTWRLAEASRARQDRLLAQVRHRAPHDPLTGLLDRASLCAFLAQELDDAADVAVLVVGLDRFEEVDDALGPAGGDELLRQVAARLSTAVRDGDLLARLDDGGFAVVLPGGSSRDAHLVADRLHRSLVGDLVVAGVAVSVEASIGAVARPEVRAGVRPGTGAAQEAEHLLRRAGAAARSAREHGGGTAVHGPAEDELSSQRLRTLADLRTALLADDELFLLYLSKVDVATERVEGIEALLRWRHPRRGMLPPEAFVPLVEGTALAVPLTHRVLAMALAQARAWNDLGHRVQVSVNVPTRCLRAPFVDAVLERLAAAGVPSSQLRLEITESALVADQRVVTDVLVRLRQAGVSISVDDFGARSTSLSALRSLPVDELKIDRSVVLGLVCDDPLARGADEALVRALVEVAHGFSLRVVAEGVEDAAVAQAAARAGCDLAQGFHYSLPSTAAAVTAALPAAPRARA